MPRIFDVPLVHAAAPPPRSTAPHLGTASAITDLSILEKDATAVLAALTGAPAVQPVAATASSSSQHVKPAGWHAMREVPSDIAAVGRTGEVGLVRRLCRDALEEIGAMANLRDVEGTDAWHDGISGFDARLLENLDLLFGACHGEPDVGALRRTRSYAESGGVVDAGRAFAWPFVAACTRGGAALWDAHGFIEKVPEPLHEYVVMALSLGSSDAIVEFSEHLCRHTDPRLAAIGAQVLYRRREVSMGVFPTLLRHGDPWVRACAARGLGVAENREQAAEVVRRALATEFEDEVYAALLESLCRLDVRGTVATARDDLARGPSAHGPASRKRAATVVAMFGDPGDERLLLEVLDAQPALALPLSWAGRLRMVSPLIKLLPRQDLQVASRDGRRALSLPALALFRITGALLPADAEASGHRPTSSVESWQTWWQANRERFDADQRLRCGRALTLGAILDELEATDHVPHVVREELALELFVHADVDVTVRAWSGVQAAALRSAREQLAARLTVAIA